MSVRLQPDNYSPGKHGCVGSTRSGNSPAITLTCVRLTHTSTALGIEIIQGLTPQQENQAGEEEEGVDVV